MYLGSVVGLAFSPFLIQNLGWPSVFYSFGSLGSIWFAFWLRKVSQFSLNFDEIYFMYLSLITTSLRWFIGSDFLQSGDLTFMYLDQDWTVKNN
jgi:hypothetical protein